MCDRCLETVDADIALAQLSSTDQDRLSLLSRSAQTLSTITHALNWIGEEILATPIVAEDLALRDLQLMEGAIRESALILLLEARRLMAKTPCLYEKRVPVERLSPPPM